MGSGSIQCIFNLPITEKAYIRRFVFEPQLSFPLLSRQCSSNLLCSLYFQVKHDHVPRATVGPDEPHAANTAWPDVLEKQDLDISYPEIEQAELEGFLSSGLPSHPKLYRGQLKNGLRYIILPNKVPPSRYGSSAPKWLTLLGLHVKIG